LPSCLDEEKEGKDLERVVPSVIAKYFVIISRELLSLLSEDWPVEVVSNVSVDLYMKKLEV
jgi:hypothetical protein